MKYVRQMQNAGELLAAMEADRAVDRSILGKTVHVVIDRPMGSRHPDHPQTEYPVNYGYVPNLKGGDGENQDVYVLGLDGAITEIDAKVVAIIHRIDDNEDKWVAVPDGVTITKADIERQTHFIERFFKTRIVMESQLASAQEGMLDAIREKWRKHKEKRKALKEANKEPNVNYDAWQARDGKQFHTRAEAEVHDSLIQMPLPERRKLVQVVRKAAQAILMDLPKPISAGYTLDMDDATDFYRALTGEFCYASRDVWDISKEVNIGARADEFWTAYGAQIDETDRALVDTVRKALTDAHIPFKEVDLDSDWDTGGFYVYIDIPLQVKGVMKESE